VILIALIFVFCLIKVKRTDFIDVRE
jgi:hypothetical protein